MTAIDFLHAHVDTIITVALLAFWLWLANRQ